MTRATPTSDGSANTADVSSNGDRPSDRTAAATIYAVAERAGVSITTVSHAFNHPHRVAEATRLRVVEAADQLGFVRRRRSGVATNTIAVVGPFAVHPSYLQRLVGVISESSVRHDVIAVNDPVPGFVLDDLDLSTAIDGLILMGAEPSRELAERLSLRGVPIVLVDWYSQFYSTVAVDDPAGGRLIAEHLLSTGARKVGFLSPPPPTSRFVTGVEMRGRALFEYLRQSAPHIDLRWLVSEPGAAGTRALVAGLPDEAVPDTIVAGDDVSAMAAVVALHLRGLRVPDDVQVIGYDDGEIAEGMGLTTVRQPLEDTGRAAARLLLAHLREPGVEHILLDPELIVRSSTRPVTP